MWIAIWIGVGIILGSIATNVIYLCRRTYGTLMIDHSDPDKDIYRINIDLDKISNKSDVTLKIDHNADLSQK